MLFFSIYNEKWKSAQRDANTARWHSQKFPPRRRPPSRGAGPPKFTQLEMVTNFTIQSTDPVWWRSMHAISSYRGNRPTNTHPHTHKHTSPQTGPITIHSAQCKDVLTTSVNFIQDAKRSQAPGDATVLKRFSAITSLLFVVDRKE